MHAVVNKLTFKEPVDLEVFAKAQQELPNKLATIDGFESFHAIQTSESEVTLLIVATDADTLDKIATEAGSPWMIANVVPLLASPPERKVGKIIASSQY